MRRIIYDVAVSHDGFIAGPGDDISLFPADGDHVEAYLARLKTYATVVMGRRTYEFGYRFGLEPGARAYPHMDHHIFSRSIALPEVREVEVVRDGLVEALRQADGDDIHLCGGGTFAGLVANAGLLDGLRLKVAPLVMAEGIPLFAGLKVTLRLRRLSVEAHASSVTFIDYEIDRTGA